MNRQRSLLCNSFFIAAAVALTSVRPAVAAENRLPADVVKALAKAETFELLSLSPEELEKPPEGAFHRWRVLGRTSVKDVDVRKRLVTAVEKGVAEATGPAKCFDPRHGVRVTRGGTTTDLAICFHCRQLYVYRGETVGELVYVSPAPESVLDKVLKDAGVTLAPKAGP